MRTPEIVRLAGNFNRIRELNEKDVRANTISGLFIDHGINISPDDVRTLIRCDKALTSKSLPKKFCKQIIQENELGTRMAAAAAR